VVTDDFEKYNTQVEDRPLYFPDLGPIEHVWVELKRRLHMKYPEIGITQEGPDKMKPRLAKVLPEIWQEILEASIENL